MNDFPYASRLNRLLGQIIDGFIAGIPVMIAVIIVALFAAVTGRQGVWFGNAFGAILFFAAMAWSAFYYFFADGFTGGQSWGKRMLGMHVIDARDRTPCSFGQSFVRNLLLAILGPIDWIFIFGERHQRLGDMLAGTVVISEQPQDGV